MNSEKHLLQCQFVHHESDLKSPGIEPALRGGNPASELWNSLGPRVYCNLIWRLRIACVVLTRIAYGTGSRSDLYVLWQAVGTLLSFTWRNNLFHY
jgi:hypothetical protein